MEQEQQTEKNEDTNKAEDKGDTEESVSLSREQLNTLIGTIQEQTEIIKQHIGIKNVAQVETKPTEELMTPGDHVEKIYQDIKQERETYRNPRRMLDYETAIGILKRKGVKNEDIASFLIDG